MTTPLQTSPVPERLSSAIAPELLSLELALLAVLAIAVSIRSWRLNADQRWRGRVLFPVGLILVVSIFAGNLYFSTGRATALASLLPAGSALTRMSSGALGMLYLRALDPWMWCLLGTIGLLFGASEKPESRFWLSSATILLAAGFALESTYLSTYFLQRRFGAPQLDAVPLLHAILTQGAVLALGVGLLRWRPAERSSLARAVCLVLGLFVAMCLAQVVIRRDDSAAKPLLIGAHYYSWFPENWRGGVLGAVLDPPIEPIAGRYLSDSTEVFAQHVAWAKQYGIDFFILDWWPQRSEIDRRIKRNLEALGPDEKFRFAFHYESLDLKRKGDDKPPDEPADIVYLSTKRADRLVRTVEYLATTYMTRPDYLRVHGRPVLFMYATRHLVGPVDEVLRQVRARVAARTGLELFIIGDEAYFTSIDYSPETGALVLPECVPNWKRLAAFDAITSYNPYDSTRRELGGSQGFERWIAEAVRMYGCYQGHANTLGIPFVPTVVPGYNDRVVRPKLGHYVVPRFRDQGRSTLFGSNLTRLAAPFIDSELNMLTVTSWNEWNEGTQIEPTLESTATQRDTSASGEEFTAGEWYRGYGFEHLEELAKFRKSLGDRP